MRKVRKKCRNERGRIRGGRGEIHKKREEENGGIYEENEEEEEEKEK